MRRAEDRDNPRNPGLYVTESLRLTRKGCHKTRLNARQVFRTICGDAADGMEQQ